MKRNKIAFIIVLTALLCGCTAEKGAETSAYTETAAAEITAEETTTAEVTTTTAAKTEEAPEEKKSEEQKRLEALIIEEAKAQGRYNESYTLQGQLFGDLDGDGTEELAAIYGDPSDTLFEDLCGGTVWYASGDAARCFFTDQIWGWLAPKTVTSQGKTFIKAEQCTVTDSRSFYLIINGNNAEVFYTPIVQGLYPDGEYGDFMGVHSTYDLAIDIFDDGTSHGLGHTYKPYWFYLGENGLNEYYGEVITLNELLSYSGAQEIVEKIEENGGTDLTIQKRGCGIITVSYRVYGENSSSYSNKNIILKYRGSAVFEEAEDEGLYLPAAFYEKTEMTDYERFMAALYNAADADPEDKIKNRIMLDNTFYAVYCGGLWQVNESGALILEENAAVTDEGFVSYVTELHNKKSAETTAQTTAVTTSQTTTEITTAQTTTTTTATSVTATTAVQTTTTPKTTKKTKKTTTTAGETTTAAETTASETTTETTTPETTTVSSEIIPESGIYTAEDGTLYIDGAAYYLTFEDEFEGDSLDTSKWEYCPEWKRQDLECYWDNGCVSVRDGKLVLSAECRDGTFYMGAVRTKNKFEQAYGYFEIKCKLNSVPGYWSAFWIMGETVGNEDGSGTDGTEIDIMESAYFGRAINHALHWDGYGVNHKSIGHQTENAGVYDGEYHTFSLLWTQSEYVFYIDGAETWRTSAEEAGGTCTAPLYLKFTAETGSWTAAELDRGAFPNYVYADYVRVYSKSE